MGTPSKDLLQLEHNKSSISQLESTLLVCKNESQPAQTKKPIIAPPPKSQLLGKMRNFLGVMSEANEKLQLDAKDNPEKYDIEALTGDESQVECMLGVVDLQTPEAVAAAEAAVSGYQPVIPVEDSSSGEESDDSSGDDEEESSGDNEDDESNEDKKTSSPDKINSFSEEFNNKRPKKRPKIIELS